MSIERSSFSPVCCYCKHLQSIIRHRCEAFDTIPEAIWSCKIKHRKPVAGDHGIQFTARQIGDPIPPLKSK